MDCNIWSIMFLIRSSPCSHRQLGHNFGLGHSNQAGHRCKYSLPGVLPVCCDVRRNILFNLFSFGFSTDADISGYMGSVLPSETRPKKCFNAAHHDALGWYDDQKFVLSPLSQPGVRVRVAAFVDHDRATIDEPVLLSLDDQYFMQFNRAKNYNEHTEEYPDKLVVTKKGEGGTELLVALGAGQVYLLRDYNGSGLTVRVMVCRSSVDDIFSADALVVGIGAAGAAENPCIHDFSGPSRHPPIEPPVSSPTRMPTVLPTRTSTSSPTFPSFQPSMVPSAIPSDLSPYPSLLPSTVTSAVPSRFPSISPNQSPRLSPKIFGPATPHHSSSSAKMLSSVPSSALNDWPSEWPSLWPSVFPSLSPSNAQLRSTVPSVLPTNVPSLMPSTGPSYSSRYSMETEVPSSFPTDTSVPFEMPTSSQMVSQAPSEVASLSPSDRSSNSNSLPTDGRVPSETPSNIPTPKPRYLPPENPHNVLPSADAAPLYKKKNTSTQNWKITPVIRNNSP